MANEVLYRAQYWAGRQAYLRGHDYNPKLARREAGYKAGYVDAFNEANSHSDRSKQAAELMSKPTRTSGRKSVYAKIAAKHVADCVERRRRRIQAWSSISNGGPGRR